MRKTLFIISAASLLLLSACGGSSGSGDTGGNDTSSGQTTYTVTPSVVSGSGGTISPSAAVSVKAGAITSFTLTPSTGYVVSSAGGTCGGKLNGYIYTTRAITGNCTVVALFSVSQTGQSYTVTPSVSGAGGGLISPDTAVSVKSGATASFTLTPNSGYSVSSINGSCSGSLSGNIYTTSAVTGNCTVVATFAASSNGTLAASSLARNTSPNVPAADATALQQGNTAFATDLYGTLRKNAAFANKNIFFSPYSISEALAMTYAGARGTTASEMKSTLHFTLPDAQLHAAFDALDLALTAPRSVVDGQVQPTLNIANSMWGQATTTFEQPFLDTLAVDYGTGVYRADFKNQPDAARTTINDWVAGKTNDKIQNLLSPSSIDKLTRLVLVNAVYFNAGWSWSAKFSPDATAAGTFHGVNGDAAAQMMHNTADFAYGAGSGWRAITLPYDGGLSFTAILPDNLATFESSFNATTLASIDGALHATKVSLTLPKFKIPGATFSVKGALETLGTNALFNGTTADLTGIAKKQADIENLYVSDVVHQAYISVDEKGTEAAAATAVNFSGASPSPPVTFTLDKPFVFLIRDNATGAILFLGRYVGG